MKKETSSNSLNEQFLFLNCELNSALNMISGRWKAQIVYSIWSGNDHFSLLKRELSAISEQVLSRQLKELETHAILVKIPIPDTVPAGISYQLTSKGIALVPILQTLCDWGKQYADGKRIHLLEDI
ncbi:MULTISPECIES: winged helix-turn-helix transcriptional regulator [unclassified Chitinophaga]|uniref:winged helix-turn-helix transcriptional regulator n=1 Tax=unclassified Chitinophaga TaxID=2619133 RepID=UPI00300FEFA9